MADKKPTIKDVLDAIEAMNLSELKKDVKKNTTFRHWHIGGYTVLGVVGSIIVSSANFIKGIFHG